MASSEKISVALTSEMADMVRNAVKGGAYASASEVIRDALRDWKYKNELRERRIEDIRRLWQEGIESGVSDLTISDIKAEARKRFDLND